jgi:arylsulfatase A-like enzyme
MNNNSDSDHPNVLFVSFDDMNHYVGFLGRHPDAVTPNLNRLAETGVVFERAYCQAPICNPSRASLMSGLRPSTTGVYNNRQPLRFSPRGRDVATLPQHFRSNGYRTTGSGKVFHGKFPDPMSWDSYFPSPQKQGYPGPAYESPLNGMKDMGNVDWGGVDCDNADMADAKSVSYCIDQLQQKHDQPFFLTCGQTVTHLTWMTPQSVFDRFNPASITLPDVREDDLDDVPAVPTRWANRKVHTRLRDEHRWRDAVASYLACIHFADIQMGRLFDALEASEYARNTVIVFWADHGWHLGEKHHWKKSTLWEEATRVPLLIAGPGIAPGRCTSPVGLIDIYPTLIDLCGLTDRADLEGQSLTPLLSEPTADWERPAITTHGRENHAVRTERWRYIRYHDGSEELYDHDTDEMEWKNLAEEPSLASVKEALAQWMPEQNADDSEIVEWPEDGDAYEARMAEIAAEQL